MMPSLSGATLVFDQASVTKSASGAAAKRLEQSCWKQIAFAPLDRVYAPKVLELSQSAGTFSFTMERVYPEPITLRTVRTLLDVVEQWVAESSIVWVPPHTLLSKVDQVERDARANRKASTAAVALAGTFNWMRGAFSGGADVPLGPCHGDLTLANVLESDEGVAMIDFMQPFISSPLLDVVKLRQDTRHGWTRCFVADGWPSMSELAEMDDLVSNRFADHRWMARWYRAFEVLNLLRILPYSGTPQVSDFVYERVCACLR